MSLRQSLLSLFDLFFAEMHQRHGRLIKARARVDRILKRNESNLDFLLAYDAFLMIREDRLLEAKIRLREASAKLGILDTDDKRFISFFCTTLLSIYDATGEAVELRRKALELNPDTLTKMLLRFPSEDKIEEIVSPLRGSPRRPQFSAGIRT